MSRKMAFAAALMLGWGAGPWSVAEEPPARKQPNRVLEGSSAEVFKPQALYELKEDAPTTGSATAAAAQEIERALKKPVELEFADTPLATVVEYCSNKLDIDIRLDSKGLTDAAVDPSAPVTFATRKPITFKSALRLILDEFDLTFVVQNETLTITSKEKADEILVTKVYFVGDLIRTGTQSTPQFGPLMNLITSTIQPDTWGDNGGPGSIQPFAREFLVFSQQQDVHDEITQLFEKLRGELKARGGATNTWKEERVTKLYAIGPVSGEQMADAIKKLVAPSSWKDQGGEGEVCVIKRIAPTLGKSNTATSGDALLVRQTGEVHDQIAELLEPQLSGGMGGGLGGGSGKGGGMFRVPPSR